MDFGNPDFAALAEAYGAHGHRISDPKAVGSCLRQAFDDGGVHVMDVPIDYGENVALLQEMKMAASAANGR